MKNLYEIFDEFENAGSKKERMAVIENNLSRVLVEVLELTFHPNYQWLIKEMPHNYTFPETPKGMGYMQLSTEIRKFYLFRAGDPAAERLTTRRRTEILLQLLESLEPREAEVVMGIFRKDLGVPGLDYNFVKEAFPALLP